MNEILLVRSAPLLQFEENLVSITKQFPRSRIHILEHHKSIPELKKRKDKFESIISYPFETPFSSEHNLDLFTDKHFDHALVQTSDRENFCPANLYDFVKTLPADKFWLCSPSSKVSNWEKARVLDTPNPKPKKLPYAPGHLKFADEMTAKMLFKKFVSLVEIETFSFCNRTCWFCPNSSIDRISKNHFMPEETYLRILSELGEIDYGGRLSYSRYNEPTADRIILKRIEQAKSKIPNATLYTHTNGDYLDCEYLEDLRKSGLDEIKIQCYFGENSVYSNEIAYKKIKRKMKKLNLFRDFGYKVISSKRIRVDTEYKGLSVAFESMDFHTVGNDRGGSLDSIHSQGLPDPCFQPVKSIYIDYNGSLVPCCNIRSDLIAHRSCILGDASKKSIFAIYGSKKAAMWRNSLKDYGKKKGFPCNTCNFR